MIKFFRRIRQQLITENKLGKYLLYAVGEIILVVIGILIALQINNNNEQRKLDRQEQNYLIALKEEFKYNKAQLAKVMTQAKNYGDAAEEILKFTGPDPQGISEEEFSKLFLNMVNSEIQFRPSNGVIEEIISSGKLDLFKNQELKGLLSSWSGVLYKVRFQEKELGDTRMRLIFLEQENGNTRDVFTLAGLKVIDVGKSRFPTSVLNLLKMQEFENECIAFLTTSTYANLNYYSNLEEKIEEILRLIEEGEDGS